MILCSPYAGSVEYTDWISAEGVRPPPRNQYRGYDIKQSDGEVPVMLELWGMRSTPFITIAPWPFWPGVVAHDRVLSMGQIELLDIWTACKQMAHVKLNCLK